MRLREFNREGLDAFRNFLSDCRADSSKPVPVELLEDESFTIAIEPEIDVQPQSFKLKREAAEYLQKKLSIIAPKKLAGSAGLWSWLSLFYFEQICPSTAGKRKVRNDYTYLFEPGSMRYTYRHLLFACWNAIELSPTYNELFLHSRVDQLDKYNSEVFKRLYITRIPCVFEVLERLYWDAEAGKPHRGIVDPRNIRAGNLMHRFPIRIRQLEKTYDLQSLTADQLIELLGDEFKTYLETATA